MLLSVSCVSSQLFDSTSFDHIKTFKTERPVNSAAISPIMDHVSEDSHRNVLKNEAGYPMTMHKSVYHIVLCQRQTLSHHWPLTLVYGVCDSGGDGRWTGGHGGHHYLHQDRQV